jgi:hypothetical protein
LDSTHLFGGSMQDPVAAASHGFSSKNEKVWDYLDLLEKYICNHRVEEGINALIMDAPHLNCKEIKRSFEATNRNLTKGMLSSMKQNKWSLNNSNMLGPWHWIKLDIGFGIGACHSLISAIIAQVTRHWDNCFNKLVFMLLMMMLHEILWKSRKNKKGSSMTFHICKHMIQSFQMSYPWVFLILWQQRDLMMNINNPQLNIGGVDVI